MAKRKRRNFTPEFKAEVVLEALSGEVHKRSCVADITSDFETFGAGTTPKRPRSDQGGQYLSRAYISTLMRHGIEISLARRGCPWENGYGKG